MFIRSFLFAILGLLSLPALATSEYRDLNYEVYVKPVNTYPSVVGPCTTSPQPLRYVFVSDVYFRPKAKVSALNERQVIQQYPLEPALKGQVGYWICGGMTAFVYYKPAEITQATTLVDDETLKSSWVKAQHVHGDWNGDGKIDLFAAAFDSEGVLLPIQVNNTGRSTLPVFPAINQSSTGSAWDSWSENFKLSITDSNRDGKNELIVFTSAESNAGIAISADTGGSFLTANTKVESYVPAPRIGDSFIDPSDVYPKTVGATGGSHSVGVEGSASYTIPIAAPAGAGGQQPNLSLAYNSNGGNGILGFGWNLNGLSRIHRCGKTLKQDGVSTTVNFTSDDQLCLDGQRLILKAGTYGSNGAEYRLENEVFIKIIAQGSTNGLPDSFLVKSPDGSSMRYGYNTDSRIEANGINSAHVLEWALDRVQDRWGNYRDYVYQEDASGGSYRLDRIEYGGSLTVSTSHTNKIILKYGSRSNGYLGYMLGSTLSNPHVLTQVEVYDGTTKLRFYAMKYEVAEHNHVIYLKGVTECSGANICLRPTTFEWEAPGSQFASGNLGLTEGSQDLYSRGSADNEHWADMDGDGKTDRVWVPSNQTGVWVALANTAGTGFGTPTQWLAKPGTYNLYSQGGVREIFTDANGDGLVDYLWQPSNDDNKLYVALNNGSALQAPTVWLAGTTQLPIYYNIGDYNGQHETFADLNSDGLIDKIWRRSNNHYYASLNTGSAFTTPAVWYTAESAFNSYSYLGQREVYIDVTGDGLPDKVWLPKALNSGSSSQNVYVARNLKTGFAAAELWLADANVDVDTRSNQSKWEGFTDLNSDGLADRYWMPDGLTPKAFYVALSTGKGFATPAIWLRDYTASGVDIYSKGGKSEYFMDVNDDGYVDRVWRPNDDVQSIYVALSTGSAFLAPEEWLSDVTAGKNVASSGDVHETFIDVSGDGVPDRVWIPSNDQNKIYVSLNQAKPSSELIKITNGFGHETKFTYAPLTDSSVYDKYAGVTVAYPLNNNYTPFVQDARRVVKKVETSNGIGGYTGSSYKYYGLRYDSINKVSLGFARIRVTNDVTGMYDTTTYNQGDVSPLITNQTADDNQQGLIVKTQTRSGTVNSPGDYLLSNTDNIWTVEELTDGVVSGQKRYVRKLLSTDITKRDLADNILYKESNAYTYDSYGHIDTQTTTSKNPDSTWNKVTTIDNDYVNFTSGEQWLIGLTSRIKVTDDVTAEAHADGYNPAALWRVSKWVYDSNGVLTAEQVWNGGETAMLMETTYSNHDAFGHALTTTVSGPDFVSRSTSVVYDGTGRFVESATNPLGHVSSQAYYNWYGSGGYPGLVQTATDINGIKTHYKYDSFGRVVEAIAAYQSGSEVSSTNIYEMCGNGCFVDHAVYNLRTQTTGAGDTVVYFDVLGREVRKAAQGFGGQYIMVDFEYNSKGQNWRTSDPYFEYGTPVWNTVQYDLRDRIIGGTQADGRVDSITYGGGYNSTSKVTATVTTLRDIGSSPHRNETKIERKNALGQVLEVEDNAGNSVLYRYDSAGNLLRTVDEAGHIVSLSYDVFGRKIAMSDPDKGSWSYAYNGLGELVMQTNARNEKTCMAYDKLGRLVKRVDSFAGNASDAANACANAGGSAKVALWTYDTAAHGKGKLASTSLSTGYAANEYSESRSYDSLGRLSAVDKTIKNTSYSYGTTYDALSRPDVITYPAVAGTALAVKHIYNNVGFLSQVRNAASNDLYYEVEAMNPRGQITIENFGNGVETVRTYDASGRTNEILTSKSGLGYMIQDIDVDFDLIGNVTRRADAAQGFEETFTYDSINRLDTATADFGNSDVRALDMSYDSLGNILTKMETGVNAHSFSYTYGTTAMPCANGSTKPHAVCAISGTKTASYAYDANGNMTEGDGRTITYASFDLPTTIVKGSATSHIAYGPDRNRYWRQDVVGSNTTTTVQVDALYEKITRPNNDVEEKHYLGNFAVVTITNRTASSAGTTSTRYLHQDHLGSLTAITDESGNLAELHNYDSWGQRRSLNATTIQALLGSSLWNNLSGLQLVSATTTRGYTGHENFDDVGIIHMNGRIYDPVIGRFLQADPVVQDTSDLQAFNRYAYVRNNPLSLTDPSGYSWLSSAFKSLVKAVKTLVKVTVAIALAPFAIQAYIARQAFRETGRLFMRVPELQVVATGVVAILTGGTGLALIAAMNAYISAAVTYQSTGSFGAALTAGATAYATAYVFNQVGKFTQGWSSAGKVAAHAFTGGAISKAQGGSFRDGAIVSGLGKAGGMVGDSAMSPEAFIASGVAGGLGSKLTGGKFADGANMAVVAHVFNAVATENAAKESLVQTKTEHVLENPESYNDGKHSYVNSEGNAECVEFVKQTMGSGSATQWEPGRAITADMAIAKGTAIATFVNGKYSGHAAVVIEVNKSGIVVLDQWNRKPIVSQRTIYFDDKRSLVNNGNNYSTVKW